MAYSTAVWSIIKADVISEHILLLADIGDLNSLQTNTLKIKKKLYINDNQP